MLREFHKRRGENAFLALPRDAYTLQYLFRVHLRVAGQSFDDELKHVRLRPFVLVRLLMWLWQFRRDIFPAAGTELRTMVGDLAAAVNEEMDVAAVERLWKKRVEEHYPETEGDKPEDERRGQVPEVFRQMLNPDEDDRDNAENLPPRKVTRFIPETKNATPGNAPETSVEAAISNSEPRCCILDAVVETQVPEVDACTAAIRSFLDTDSPPTANDAVGRETVPGGIRTKVAELTIQTGFDLQEQWKGAYVSEAMPFTIPRAISGPTFFPTKDAEDTGFIGTKPLLTVTAFLSGFSRRVENMWLRACIA